MQRKHKSRIIIFSPDILYGFSLDASCTLDYDCQKTGLWKCQKSSATFVEFCRQKWLQNVTQKLQLVNHRAGVSPFHLSLGRLWNLGSYARTCGGQTCSPKRGIKVMKSYEVAKNGETMPNHQHFHQGGSNFDRISWARHGKTDSHRAKSKPAASSANSEISC